MTEVQWRIGDRFEIINPQRDLLGRGGMGKTRLGLEAAARQLDHYPHGVYWVPLAPLRTVEAVVPAIASALGFQFYEGGTPRQQLLDYLREKHMLLLLDNYEHLLNEDGGAVEIVVDVVAAAPRVKLLATSRARLNVRGEHRFHIRAWRSRIGKPPRMPWSTVLSSC